MPAKDGGAHANVKGLYAHTLRNTNKASETTDEDGDTGDSNASSVEGDSTAALSEEDSAASVAQADGVSPTAALTYTARGVLAAAPSQAGGVFQATV